jgi:hypothetical protein
VACIGTSENSCRVCCACDASKCADIRSLVHGVPSVASTRPLAPPPPPPLQHHHNHPYHRRTLARSPQVLPRRRHGGGLPARVLRRGGGSVQRHLLRPLQRRPGVRRPHRDAPRVRPGLLLRAGRGVGLPHWAVRVCSPPPPPPSPPPPRCARAAAWARADPTMKHWGGEIACGAPAVL